MQLELKRPEDCMFDEISLGEIMLRLDPGAGRIKNSRSFTAWEGGGEYNVARGLRRCFGLRTAVITALADNEVGRLIEDFILQGGVDTSFIKWMSYDGIGRNVRNGLNFTERGYGIRGAVGVSDRGNTAASQLRAEDVDWDYIFGKLGVRWLHTGGIFAALSETSAQTVIAAVKKAKEYGTVVSYDLNYRPSLWKGIGGQEKAQQVNREIAKYIDVMIGNEEDFTACLGLEVEGNDAGLKKLNVDGYCKMIENAVKVYPNFKVVATTLRTVKTATVNDWSAICWADGKLYEGMKLDSLEIFDRVGGGDSFASGLIYGLMTEGDPRYAVNCGIAHGALAMTTPGDTSMASKREVEAVMNGAGAAGIAIAKHLLNMGVKNITLCDSKGIICKGDERLNAVKREMAEITNLEHMTGTLADAMKGADVFLGISAAGCVSEEMVASMAKDPILFAMANPTPEIMPDLAKKAGAAVVGTGRSDFPNQINNVLAFPGIFRGALDCRASDINEEMKVAASFAIASLVSDSELNADYILPEAFDKRIGKTVAEPVKKAAIETGVARI